MINSTSFVRIVKPVYLLSALLIMVTACADDDSQNSVQKNALAAEQGTKATIASRAAELQTAAQETYRVIDVAADDVLNIRATPGSKGELVGSIPSDGHSISKIGEEGRWVQISYQGVVGWVHGRYLSAQNIQPENNITIAAAVNEELFCIGTEPHWNLKTQHSDVEFSFLSDKTALQLQTTRSIANSDQRGWQFAFKSSNTLNQPFTATVIQDETCSDDMSDDQYRYAITLERDGQVLTGCCNKR